MRRLIMVLAGFLVLVPLALGTPTVTLHDGIHPDVVCADGSACDLNAAAGAITYSGAIGVWTINVTTGITKPAQGSALEPFLHFNSIDLSSGAGTLTLTFSEDGFGPIPSGVATQTAKIGPLVNSAAGSSISYSTFLDTTAISNLGPYGAGATSGGTDVRDVSAAGTYSLSQQVVLTHGAAGSSSFDATLAVSEPGSLLLLGSGLLGIGAVLRRKKTA